MKKIGLFLALLVTLFLVACGGDDVPSKGLPDLTGKNKSEIETIFNDMKIVATIDFVNQYRDDIAEGLFVSYANNHQMGDEIEAGEVVVIYISSKRIQLPNLTGLNKDEMIVAFEALGVPRAKLSFIPDVNSFVEPGTFIGYAKNIAGDYYDLSSAKLTIYYDVSIALPDLTGKNLKQITDILNKLSISLLKFEYVLDNTKEFDQFAGYVNYNVGAGVTGNDEIIISLYTNNDVNIHDQKPNTTELFISKYIDGDGSNKSIELFNSTAGDIQLSDYYVAILANGSYVPTATIELSGVLASNKTFVITSDKAAASIRENSDLVSASLMFDGNDTIQLRRKSNDTYTDSIYDVGNISIIMDGEVFVRRSYITAGRRDFAQAEWIGFVPTETQINTVLGTHPYEGALSPVFNLIADKTFQQYGMTKVELISVADGDTIYVKSVDPRDTTSYTGDSRLRFLLVDTPETAKPANNYKGDPYANVATSFTKNMLENAAEIYIQSDPSAGLTETYGRHLALIWVNTGTIADPNWKLLNYELLKYGLGEKNSGKTTGYEKAPIFGNRYLYQWAESALLHAQENKLGLFSGVHQD